MGLPVTREHGVWVTEEEYRWRDIVVPEGFTTDLASVPRFLWAVIAPFDLSIEAPVVHDWLYRNGGLGRSRAECDRLFLELMEERGVPFLRRRSAYYAVRLFGARAFVRG